MIKGQLKGKESMTVWGIPGTPYSGNSGDTLLIYRLRGIHVRVIPKFHQSVVFAYRDGS